MCQCGNECRVCRDCSFPDCECNCLLDVEIELDEALEEDGSRTR